MEGVQKNEKTKTYSCKHSYYGYHISDNSVVRDLCIVFISSSFRKMGESCETLPHCYSGSCAFRIASSLSGFHA